MVLSSRPLELGGNVPGNDQPGIQNGYGRAMLNWYTVDPIFYSARRPDGVSDEDLSSLYTSRVFINELFPEQDLVQGQNSILFTLDLAYYPTERGPYNFQPGSENGVLSNPQDSWAGITRQLTSTDLEQANVEYIEFWLQDPFQENPANPGGKLVFNLGNISEDIIKDGRKLYENGLPENGDISLLPQTAWGSVVPLNQSLVYAFDTTGEERTNQDVGYDGYSDQNEIDFIRNDNTISDNFANLPDPSNDNYTFFLDAEGGIFERYKKFNGVEGNTPDVFTDTQRGTNPQPDVEDINRDNTMNTIDSYYEYELDITPATLNINNEFIVDTKNVEAQSEDNRRVLENGEVVYPKWYLFRIPVTKSTRAIGGITDFRSVRFVRTYLKDFNQNTVFRFGTLDLVRSDWRRYNQSLAEDNDDPTDDGTDFSVGIVGTIDNEGSYVRPPGIEPEQLFNNNTVVRQNEQALVVNVCNLETEDSRAVFKNINIDMRQFKRLRMFLHAQDDDYGFNDTNTERLVGFMRIGNDLNDNYYQIEIPLVKSPTGSIRREDVWPFENEINLAIDVLGKIKAQGISDGTLLNGEPVFYDVVGDDIIPVADQFSGYVTGQHRVAIKGNPNFGDVRTLMVGVKNATNSDVCANVWFNELRLSDMDNEGGWAAVVSMDTNIADFANISATGRQSTSVLVL